MKFCFYTLIAYDYKMSYAAISSYYKIADKIILAIDLERKAFNGQKYEFNEDEFFSTINKIDVKNKIEIVQGNFHSNVRALDNEVEERNLISNKILNDENSYLIAIDSDEVLLNPDEFASWLDVNQNLANDIECESYIVFKQFGERLLVIEPIERNPIGTKTKNNYRRGKKTFIDKKILCPAKIIHYQWARDLKDVQTKLNNCSYSIYFDKGKFLNIWQNVNLANYESFTNFNPLDKNLWKNLKVFTVEKFSLIPEVKQQVYHAKKDKLSILVPVKDQYQIAKKCLDSILKYYSEEEIVIIDDGSTEDTTINMLKDYSKKFAWKLIRNTKSLGHSKACELAVANSQYENMFLLNSDVILTRNSLKGMAEILNNNEKIAVIGPTTSATSGVQQNAEANKNRFVWNVERIEEFAEGLTDNSISDIDLVGGFCFGIKRSVFKEVGGFDKNLNCYGNEKELLIRIRKLGYRTVWLKNVYVHHFGKMSYSNEKSIDIARCQMDGDNYIRRKHGKLS